MKNQYKFFVVNYNEKLPWVFDIYRMDKKSKVLEKRWTEKIWTKSLYKNIKELKEGFSYTTIREIKKAELALLL